LGRIIHDWDEENIKKLLKKIYAALPKGGALIIFEKILDDDKCGDIGALLQSLNMMVQMDGKERNMKEYKSLLEEAGFSNVEYKKTGLPLDVIIAFKTIL